MAWRGRRSQKEAGNDIGRSARQIRDYEAGRAEVDQAVEMAMCADTVGLRYIEEAKLFKKSLDEQS